MSKCFSSSIICFGCGKTEDFKSNIDPEKYNIKPYDFRDQMGFPTQLLQCKGHIYDMIAWFLLMTIDAMYH